MSDDRDDRDDLDALRAELSSVDREILALAARRRALAQAIGARKRSLGRPTRDFEREFVVFTRARAHAAELGLAPELADRLLTALIDSSLTAQEHDRLTTSAAGAGRSALVIGGAGKMGRWFAGFLAAQGFHVRTADPAGPTDGLPHTSDWSAGPVDDDLVVVAAPLDASGPALSALARRHPPGVVFDLASLKTPVRAGLSDLRDAGVRVTSLHPMFGPDVRLLAGRHVVFVDCGVPEATAAVRSLFHDTMAIQVDMDLEAHDRAMAWVLGLSHAVNIAFFTALSSSGAHAPRLSEISSTTFAAQEAVARRVASESAALYYEIQTSNAFGLDALRALDDAVRALRAAVEAHDRDGFVAMMDRGRRWFGS